MSNTPAGARIGGELILSRDERLRQPLPDVAAPKLDSAAAPFAKAITAARGQLRSAPVRERAHDGSGQRAVAAVRDGVAAYAQSTTARMCLVWSLHQSRAPASEVLDVARQILAIDSNNAKQRIEYAAIALDSLRRRDEAATMWLRFADTDTANIDLAIRVDVRAVRRRQRQARRAVHRPRVGLAIPEELSLVQQKWRVAYENRSWTHTIEAGEVMLARDEVAHSDSTFFLKLGTAYHAANQPFRALETLAHGVDAFPTDVRLYALYAQYVKAEADTVVPRGSAPFLAVPISRC